MKRKTICITVALMLVATVVFCAPKKSATLKLTAKNVVLEMTLNSGRKLRVTTKGTKIPAGTHFVKSLRLLKKDKKNRLWEMRSAGTLQTLKTITVAAGQEKILDTGGRISFKYFIWPNKRSGKLQVLFRITCQGGYGEVYYPGAYLKGKRPQMPAYRITSDTGKVLASGRLALMPSGLGKYSWPVPKGLTGKCKIEIKPTMGPFDWGSSSSTFSPKPRN